MEPNPPIQGTVNSQEPEERASRSSFRAAALVTGLGVTVLICETLPLLPGPQGLEGFARLLLQAAVFSLIPLLIAVLTFPVLLVLAIYRQDRRSKERLVLCIGVALTVFLALSAGRFIRRARFAAAAENAAPAIEALQAHRARTGTYPDSTTLPFTGLMAYPRYHYRLPSGESKCAFEEYELSIQCPLAALNFDRFVYWPSKAYPSSMYGGVVERIGDWAYVHE